MIETLYYLAAAIALFSSIRVVTGNHAVHALLWLVVAQLSMAVLFFLLGAPFAAALEVLVYAGAILVLFIFVVMMLNLGRITLKQEKQWFPLSSLLVPTLLCGVLLAELLFAMSYDQTAQSQYVAAKQVGISLFGPYLLVVELISMLLLSGLTAAWHLTRPYLLKSQASTGVAPPTDLRSQVQKEPWL